MSSPQTGTFEDVAGQNRALVRKMLKMAVYVGKPTVPIIDSIVNDDNELTIPAGMISLGHVSPETGAEITPTLEISEIAGYGEGQPLRRDTVSRASTLAVTALESKKAVFEAYYGIDLTGIVATSEASGKNELTFDQPDLPDVMDWRVLLLGRDGRGTNAIYHGEYFPLMSLSDVGARTWSPTDGMTWPMTFGATTDDVAGTPQRTFWAGPGLTTQKLTAMGFARAT